MYSQSNIQRPYLKQRKTDRVRQAVIQPALIIFVIDECILILTIIF